MSDLFRAFAAKSTATGHQRGLVDMHIEDLPADGLLIDVTHSSVNYKDALAASATGRVARLSPLVVGIDLAGTVRESDDPAIPSGTEVLAHGYDIGVSRHGGFAEVARVPAGWLVPLPTGLSAREAMTVGTAGYTAALSVLTLVDHGIRAADGPILVTGATGGVGSLAVQMLTALGYNVAASTGKAEAEPFLRELGAADVIARSDLTMPGKPLQPANWAGCVDCVGGTVLAHVLASLRPGGAVAASGNVGGVELDTTVLPFILRGITLYGIDSVSTPIERRRAVWDRIATDLRPANLGDLERLVTLDTVGHALDQIAAGAATGRYVVDIRG